jgi:SAM-dependent methyltransferase
MLRAFDVKNMLLAIYHKVMNKGVFFYDGKQFRYFIHWYNHTWDNCRKIEIPVFLKIYYENQHRSLLEVGNVLSHYIPTTYDVLDKYEKSYGVINEDIISYKPEFKYDVVISCSTLEHVGFDEEMKDPDGFVKAVENIKKNILKPGGVLFLSVPLGYNPGLDKAIRENRVCFDYVTHFSQESWHIIIGAIKN